MDGRWLYSSYYVGCCLHDLIHIAHSIFVWLPSSFFSIRFAGVHILHPFRSIDTTTAWKKNCVLFYRSGLTSIWHRANRLLSMALLVACWCLSRLVRHCFLDWWTCPLVSENYHLVWRCRLFDLSTCCPSCLRWHALYQQLFVSDYVAGFRLGRGICQKRYVIGVVGVRNCLCELSFTFVLCQLETVVIHFISRRSKQVV